MGSESTRVLVLGGQGMLGHAVYRYLKQSESFEVQGTHHSPTKDFFKFDGYHPEADLMAIYQQFKFDWVVNAVGILQQAKVKTRDFEAINAKLPKTLEKLTQSLNFNLIHISTDAVFPMTAGPVNEDDKPNPEDTYGQSKLAGEVTGSNSLTIRTSVIGLDPFHHRGLLEWALTQNKMDGYLNQTWSGATNWQLAQFISEAIHARRTGLVHFAPLGSVTKYELLREWIKLNQDKPRLVNKAKGNEITRYLISKTPAIHQGYERDITAALKNIIIYERKKIPDL